MKKITLDRLLALFVLLLLHQCVQAEVLSCGLKTVTLKENKIIQIRHEDGTVHRGSSISSNWDYDGNAIRHIHFGDVIPCGTKPKTRQEIISELSSRFIEDPHIYNMNKQEAKWMTEYTARMMTSDLGCHLIITAAKSTQRKGMFYIDCNNKVSKPRRYWVSSNDLAQGIGRNSTSAISEARALDACNGALRAQAMNPATYDPSLITGSTSRIVESVGRNVVEINFTAENGLGIEGKYLGRCVLEAGMMIEAVVTRR
jgi:hypothetical protein